MLARQLFDWQAWCSISLRSAKDTRAPQEPDFDRILFDAENNYPRESQAVLEKASLVRYRYPGDYPFSSSPLQWPLAY